MILKDKKIGVAICSSFCIFDKVFLEIKNLVDIGADVYPIFSNAVTSIENKYGSADDFINRIESITGRKPILSIADAEPIGAQGYLDILTIMPCTGNTIGKLANGITDTPVLMAAKGHLRNNKPLVISISTNDGLGMNMKNVGLLMNVKNIYFVPFGQDNAIKKPNSLIANCKKVIPTLEKALENKQIQPVLI